MVRAKQQDSDVKYSENQICCCPPRARIWMERRTEAIYVENEIDMKRRLMARADANTSIRPPSGPDTNADGSGGSQIDEGTFKKQGKIYRTDLITIHWCAEGKGDLRVQISASGGNINYHGDWMPNSGSVTLPSSDLLEPPYYGSTTFGNVEATIDVEDCCGSHVRQSQTLSGEHPIIKPKIRGMTSTVFRRGTEETVVMSGENLLDVSEVHFKVNGLDATISPHEKSASHFSVMITVSPNSPVAGYDLDNVLVVATDVGVTARNETGMQITISED